MAEPFDDLIKQPSGSLSPLTGEGIVIDIGTGDGLFVYQCARANPNKFYVVSTDLIDRDLIPRYVTAGFEILERGVLAQSEWPKLQTSWAKRLQANESREVVYIIARATNVMPGSQ